MFSAPNGEQCKLDPGTRINGHLDNSLPRGNYTYKLSRLPSKHARFIGLRNCNLNVIFSFNHSIFLYLCYFTFVFSSFCSFSIMEEKIKYGNYIHCAYFLTNYFLQRKTQGLVCFLYKLWPCSTMIFSILRWFISVREFAVNRFGQ